VLVRPNFLRLEWPEEENLNNIKRLIKYQKLDKFLRLTRNLYLDLVRVFFTNLSIEDKIMCSHVKGVDMILSDEDLLTVTRLKDSGRIVGRGNMEAIGEFNKVEFFKSCLRNPQAVTRGYPIGGLKMNLWIIASTITWQLIPCGCNHVVIAEEDLMLIYYITQHVKINWVYVIKE